MPIILRSDGPVTTILIDRPQVRNAVDRDTATALAEAFRAFDATPDACVAILGGTGGTFCAGADLKAFSTGEGNRLEPQGDGPMGPSRLALTKPVIAAIDGHAVAGGLELACWADLRIMEESAVLGVFCRRVGVPLIDGGTVRLPRLIGMSRAMDLILTGRAVSAEEALGMGLVNRVVPDGTAHAAAQELAAQLARLPQQCLRADLQSTREAFDRPEPEAIATEFQRGMSVIQSGETLAGATRFAKGAGRHGQAIEDS